MINRVFLDPYGKILTTLTGTGENLAINPLHPRFVDVDKLPESNTYYDGDKFVTIPPKTKENTEFDYVTKSWKDLRSITDVRDAHWTKLKIERDIIEFGGFEFEGKVYDSDQVSQGRIMGAATAGMEQVWTLQDNSLITLSPEQLIRLYMALQRHISAAHERGRIARHKIDNLYEIDSIEAVTL